MSNPSTSGDNAALHPVATQSRVRESTLRDRFMANGSVVSIAIFFLVVCLLFSVVTDAFMTAPNLLNIVRQSAPLLIVAAAMTFVITTGGIDLSVGSVLALVATLSAVTLQAGLPWPLVIIAMLLLGAAVGAIQGFFIAYERIPAFIVTLAGLSVIRGIALLITGGYSIPVEATSPFTVIGRAWFLGVPVPALIALAVLVVAYLAFNETRFGRYVTGIGANAEAVRRAGVDTRLTTLMVYVLSSTAAAAAGIILAARLGSGSSNAGQGFELEVIAAVVLGGTSLFGGRGTLVGTVLGAMTVAVIANGLILAHMSPFLTPIVTGTIILIAIWLNFRLFRGAIRSR
jgi:simple sugar transport system permease protein